MLIPTEALDHFTNAIYLPLLLVVLELDRTAIEVGDFKFKDPYLNLIQLAENQVSNELKDTNNYFRQNKMKLVKLGNDGTFTDYEFHYGAYIDKRRYLNIRLRNRTSELLGIYITKGDVER